MRSVDFSAETADTKAPFTHRDIVGKAGDVSSIVAKVDGEYGDKVVGADWHWILRTKGGKFQYATASSDIEGDWQKQASGLVSEQFDTVEQALERAPLKDYARKGIRSSLAAQVSGKADFGSITEK